MADHYYTAQPESKHKPGLVTYTYREENGKKFLRVYKQEELIFEDEVGLGEGFYLVVNQKGEYVTYIGLPEKREELVAYLLGFEKRETTNAYEDYLQLLEDRRETCAVSGYMEKTSAGPNFEFTRYCLTSEEVGASHPLACWVHEEVSDGEIIHMMPDFVYPLPYICNILENKLGISSKMRTE